MATQDEFRSSVSAVRQIAVFADELLHRVKDEDLVPDADMVQLAKKYDTKIPTVLADFEMRYNSKPHQLADKDIPNTIVVELPPRTAGSAQERKVSGCIDVKKGPISGHVCVSCEITWTKVTCKITITITVGF